MKHTLTSLLILSVLTAFAQKQPALQLTVSVDGKPYQVKEGDTLRVDNKTIVVTTAKYAAFDYGALKFDYPKNFSFEEEKNIGIKTWTLTGNDFTVMYFEIAVEVSLETFADEFVKKFGRKNCKISETSTTLGGMTLKGKHIKVELAGQKLGMDMLKIPNNDEKIHLLIFQDTVNDDGSPSNESIETLKVINASLKVKPGDE